MDKIEFKDKLVSINRITKVVKGGRRFTFSALVVVGNYAGSVGVGYAKAKQVPNAIKKATQNEKKRESLTKYKNNTVMFTPQRGPALKVDVHFDYREFSKKDACFEGGFAAL